MGGSVLVVCGGSQLAKRLIAELAEYASVSTERRHSPLGPMGAAGSATRTVLVRVLMSVLF